MRVTVLRSERLRPAERAAARDARLGALLRHCGDVLGVPPRAGLALRLTDDAELTELNARFAGIPGPTDVLSFPGDGALWVGDVAISVERALAQASDGVAELRLLAVHGLLHCLGYDHADPDGAAAMTAATRRLLPDQEVCDLLAATHR